MTFLNPLDALIPKIPFSFFADFSVRVTSEARGSVSVGFWGSRQLSPFWGGSSQGALSTPSIESPPAPGTQPPPPPTCPPLAVFSNPPSSPPTQRVGSQPPHPQVEDSPLKRRTGAFYPPSYSFSLFGSPPLPPGGPSGAQDSATWPRPSGHLFRTAGTPKQQGVV